MQEEQPVIDHNRPSRDAPAIQTGQSAHGVAPHIAAPARARWWPAAPFTAMGTGCVAGGGLVSAVTAPAPTEQSAWAVAYLVLVAGLSKILLGIGRTVLSSARPARGRIATELVAWNAANAAILAGTLERQPLLLYVGAAALLTSLGMLVEGGHGSSETPRWLLPAFRFLVALLAVSVPVGLLLAALRPY